MTVHCARDLVVGSTGSYSNMYAIGCFLLGVLGFTQVSAGGRGEWQGMLPSAILTGTMARFPGMQMYSSGGTGIVEIPISQLDVLPDDEVGFVYSLRLPGFPKAEYLDVGQAYNLWMSKPMTSPFLFGVTGSTIPNGTAFVTQSGGTYYIGHNGMVSGAITMNIAPEQVDIDPVDFVDSAGNHTWIPDSDDPSLFPNLVDFVLAIKSTTSPLANSGLYRIYSAGASPGYSLSTGSATGTFRIFFDTRTADTQFPLPDTNFAFSIFHPVEEVHNDLDQPYDPDPDHDGDIDVPGYDGVPAASTHYAGNDPVGAGGPDFFSYTYTPPAQGPPFRNYYDDHSPPPFDQDDSPGKSSNYFIWSIGSESNRGTLVASLLDRPAFNSTPDDGLYHGQGGSNRLRVIYQSPHSTGWQVRMCMESSFDTGDATAGGAVGHVTLSIAPGFSGSNGDFQTRGPHLHGAQWYNTASSSYRGLTVGLNPNHSFADHTTAAGDMGNVFASHGIYDLTSFQAGTYFPPSAPSSTADYRWRMYMWGDDVTGAVVICSRGYFNASDEFAAFGLPEDETLPLPPDPVMRLFVIGQADFGEGVDWRSGTQQDDGIAGVAYSLDSRRGPISCVMATYAYVASQNGNGNSIRFDSGAGDTPFLNSTEVIPVDLIAGSRDSNQQHTTVQVIPMEPRRLGRMPIARMGRANAAAWSAIGDAKSWFHATNGMYLPWGGMTALP